MMIYILLRRRIFCSTHNKICQQHIFEHFLDNFKGEISVNQPFPLFQKYDQHEQRSDHCSNEFIDLLHALYYSRFRQFRLYL